MAIVKKVKRAFKKARGKVIKRYFNKGYSPKISTMYKDIVKVKNMLNAEKKQISNTITGGLVGQCAINSTNFRAYDITPIPAQGTGQGQRTGNSIKACSSYALFQFIQQANMATNMRIKIMLIQPQIYQSSASTFVGNILENSTWSGIQDYNSQLNPNYRNQYKIIMTKYLQVNLTNYSSAVTTKTFSMPLRWNHHIRFTADGSTTPTDGQIIMVILADSGNTSGTVSTLTNIPILTANSGMTVNYDWNWFYYDN